MTVDTAQNVSAQAPSAQIPRWFLRSTVVAVACVVSALLIWRTIDAGGAVANLENVASRPELIAAFAAVYTIAFALRTMAWRSLLPSLSAPRMFGILQVSLFLNHLLPLKAGDVSRVVLASRHGASTEDAAVSTVVSRIVDLAALLALAVVCGVIAQSGVSTAIVIPAALIAVAAVALAILRVGTLTVERLPLVARFRDALGRVSVAALLRSLAWSLASWIAEGLAVYAIVSATGHDISLAAVMGAVAFTILFQSIHLTPGGLGVYEASMASALAVHGIPFTEGAAIALATHAVKFAYAWSVGLVATAIEGGTLLGSDKAHVEHKHKEARRIEIVMARLWNLANEGKPFTPLFAGSVAIILTIVHSPGAGHLLDASVAALAIVPLALVFYRFDFPLKLRAALWVYLAAFLAVFGALDWLAVGLVVGLYFGFTVGLWGTVYYHLRIGMPWSNFFRFWRLVIENPDTTSGNFLEQMPKVLLLVLSFQYIAGGPTIGSIAGFEAFVFALGLSAVLVHQWFFTWVPSIRRRASSSRPPASAQAKRVILIVIDGCRADRLIEADTPFIDRLRAEGVDFTDVSTVYPARTVTCFSSMLTGAPPEVHGMRSNFVPDLGVKCDSLFEALDRNGMSGRLVGIAHLVDAFGDRVRAVSAVMDNEDVDEELASIARDVMESEDPELLILQLISVDQTGHARGSYNREYLERIEAADRTIERFLGWCDDRSYLEDATVIITADHGQGIGIGGHGHMSRTEIHVPCIAWGAGISAPRRDTKPRSIVDMAATVSDLLGIERPAECIGASLLDSETANGPLAVIIPAHNEAANLPGVLSRIPASLGAQVIVVDDGSTDETAEIARAFGATVVQHATNRGLGAALRTGLETARDRGARAAVYIDADNEYDPAEIPLLLSPIEAGEADYVIGSRYRGQRAGQRAGRMLGNLFFTALLCIASGRRISDGQSGFRAFSRRALECAEIIHDYNYAQVLTLDLLKKGMRYREVPISYQTRRKGRSFIGWKYLWHVPVGMARQLMRA